VGVNSDVSEKPQLSRKIAIRNKLSRQSCFDSNFSFRKDDVIAESPSAEIHKRYSILKVIGEGGFGRIYSALDRQTKLRVAIKQIEMTQVSQRSRKNFNDSK
jgi:serine/threonine protein kinase